MPAIEVNNVVLNYEEKGKGKDVVMALPGFGTSARSNLIGMQRLADHFRVIALDIRGHGKSAQVTEGWTLKQIADDVYQVAKKLGLGKYICLGGSMGGAIALRVALDHPETIKKLVLVSSMPACGSTTPKEIIEQALAYTGNLEANIAMTKALFVRPIPKEFEDRLEEFVRDTLLVQDSVKRAWLLKEQYYNWESELKNVPIPALVIYGDKDNICNPAAQHTMATLLPNAKEIIIPDAGHAMMFEATDVATKAIVSFING